MASGRTITDIYSLETESDLRGLNIARDSIDDLANEIADAGKTAQDSGDDFERGSSGLSAFSGAALGVVAALGGMAVLDTVTSQISGAVSAILSADQSFNLLEAQTGMATEEIDGFRDSARDIYEAGIGESLDEITQAMSTVSRVTDIAGQDLEAMTANALVLSQVTGYDVSESVRTADALMRNFGISGTEAMDLIARGYQVTGDKSGDMLDTINEYSAVFEEAGYDAEEMFFILSQGSDAGAFNLDKIADGAKEFGIRMREGGDEARLAWATLFQEGGGFNYVDYETGTSVMIDSSRELFDMIESGAIPMDIVADRAVGLFADIEDPAERARLGVALFGSAWEDLGEDVILASYDLGNMEEGILQADGTMDKMKSTMSRGLTPQWERFTRAMQGHVQDALTPLVGAFVDEAIPAMEDMADFISNDVIPAVEDATEFFIDFTDTVIDTVSESEQLENVVDFVTDAKDAIVDMANGAVEALGGIEAITATAESGFNAVLSVVSGLASVFANLSPESLVAIAGAIGVMVAPAIIAGIGALIGGVIGLGGALGGALVAATPLLALMALIVAYETDFGGLKTAVDDTREAFSNGDWQGGITGVANALLAIPMGITQELTGWSKEDISGRLQGWVVAGDAVKAMVYMLGDALKSAWQATLDFLSPVWDAATSLWSGAVDGVKSSIDLFKTAVDLAKTGIDLLLGADYGGMAATAFATFQGNIDTYLVTPFNNAKDTVMNLIEGPSDSLKSYVMSIAANLVTWLGDIAAPFLNLTGPIATAVSTVWSKLLGPEFSLKSYVESMVAGLSGWLSGIADAVSGPFNTFRDAIQGPIDKIGELIGKISDLANVELFGVSINDARNLLGFAEGGPIAGGTLAVVGERGPELFYAPSNGVIIPNDVSRQLVSGGGPALPGGRGFGGANEAVNLTVYLDGQVIYDRMQTIKGNRAL